ncbi:hypothetical protein Pr1d_18500 [Bythopirellula goksoeyrii]|uniref:Uncharacterized protein n=1 Tax=Bythopirellula goksoeyrii TaxID=1400387 RepID=A0A5B9Q9Y9_9BACT|nr:hypothetical protein Pr1d_18500 [Bythopirellula goksoeyrii]
MIEGKLGKRMVAIVTDAVQPRAWSLVVFRHFFRAFKESRELRVKSQNDCLLTLVSRILTRIITNQEAHILLGSGGLMNSLRAG